MKRMLSWLENNKLIAILLTIALFFSIVTFHDEVTQLAIKIRNALGKEKYNQILGWSFLILLLLILTWVAFDIFRKRRKALNVILMAGITLLLILAFRILMVYNIEAIHFVEYMIVAIILFPILKSYGETVFWVTFLGILDELFQYIYLTPEFKYFDFNDCLLNLLGSAAGMVLIFVSAGNVIEIRRMKWYRSPAVLTGLGMLTVFFVLLLLQKISINPVETPGTWFSINRKSLPDDFWTEAYPGRVFHILKPIEGILVMIVLFAGFSMLDLNVKPQRFL